MEIIQEFKDVKISNESVIVKSTMSFELTPEDIREMIAYVRSEKNDKLLLQYKDLPDEELATVIVEEYKKELYSTLEKLCRE